MGRCNYRARCSGDGEMEGGGVEMAVNLFLPGGNFF